MIGRSACETPWMFADFDRVFFNRENPGNSRREILHLYGDYRTEQIEENQKEPLPTIIKPILTLLTGEKYCTIFKSFISERKNFI